MDRGPKIVRGVLAALAVVCAAPLAASAQTEQRCSELGGGCVCAESLNTSENITNGTASWNPSNSSTKQCPNFELPYNGMSTVAQVQSNADNVRWPSGANPYVHREALSGHGSTSGGIGFQTQTNVTNETLCNRHYFRFSAGHGTPNDCSVNGHRIKIIGTGHLTGASSISGIQSNCSGPSMYFGVHDSAYNGADFNDSVSGLMDTCTSYWCRIEICMDLAGTNLKFRGRITSVGGPLDYISRSDQGTGPSTYYWDSGGMSTYTQGSIGAGYQYRSHHMVARVPVNSNFWIGPAYEVEGGGGTNPPPPPPAPPIAPMLIQD